VPPEVAKALKNGEPAPAGLSNAEKAAYESLANLYKKGGGYAAMMVTRPQTEGYSLADSPAGQAAWMYDKFAEVCAPEHRRRCRAQPAARSAESVRRCDHRRRSHGVIVAASAGVVSQSAAPAVWNAVLSTR
jgi:hypothetical protein